MELFECLIAILSGLAVTIPLVIKLVEYVKLAIQERNWSKLLNIVIGYMEVAETKFETGAERKEWVLSMVAESADIIDYNIDMELVGQMIDRLCDMSNVINPPEK